MGRRAGVPGGRPVFVAVKLSMSEKALLDGLVADLGVGQSEVLRRGLGALSRELLATGSVQE